MIDPKELRIGNLVEKPDGIGMVVQINPFVIGFSDDRGALMYECHADLLDPIPITPEWLGRLGFVHSGEHGLYRDDCNSWWEIVKDIEGDDNCFYICHDSIGINLLSIPIWNVHELQNLYFALTGEELKLKQD